MRCEKDLAAEVAALQCKLERWEQVWTALNDMGAAVTASWALMQRENAELQSKLDESQEQRRRATEELERTENVVRSLRASLKRAEGQRDELAVMVSQLWGRPTELDVQILKARADEVLASFVEIRDGEVVNPPLVVEGNPVRREDPIKAAFVEILPPIPQTPSSRATRSPTPKGAIGEPK